MASRYLRSLLTTGKQSVIHSLLRRSPPASGRASLLRRLWPFTHSTDANNNNSPQALTADTGGGLSKAALNNPTPTPTKLRTREYLPDWMGLDLAQGFDFEHWIVGTDRLHRKATRDEVIDSFIKTLAKVVGSEEEARKKIYSVYTYELACNAFAAQVAEEIANKLYELDNVKVIIPDSYMDVENKRYAGEPFINGQAVPFHHKYHLERLRFTRMQNQNKNKSNDRSPNCDKSRVSVTRKIDVPAGSSDLPENNRSNMGQPPSNCGGHLQLGYAGEPGKALASHHGNVPMSSVSA